MKKIKKILVFNGSPKKEKSDTLHITNAFFKWMKSINDYDITMIDVIDKNINYCKGCFTCKKNGRICIYDDDMKEILKIILNQWCNSLLICLEKRIQLL